MSTTDSKLFSSIKYFPAGLRDPTIESTFKQNGATRSFYLTETTTHVICDDFDSNKSELEQAIEIYQTPIVTSGWITACLKCNTLLPIEPFRSAGSDDTDHLFRSCTFANANLAEEDHKKLYALVTYYGGRWVPNIDASICTHIICASALPNNETENGTENNHDKSDERLHDAYEIQSETIRLITPDWILDCLNRHQLVNEADYHPDLLRDPNEPMDVDEEEIDDETTNNLSTEDHTPTKTTTTTHRSQLITKNFFNQADQTTPPPSAEPPPGTNDSSQTSEAAETSQTKALAPKRARARATATTPRQRNTKINSVTSNSLHSNQNGHVSVSKDGQLSTLPIEEKLIRPSVSSNVLNNKTNLPLARQPPPETLSYELNYCVQDKHELVPSSQCLLGCVIFIDERDYMSTVSKEDLSAWSTTLSDHGAIVTDDLNDENLTHFVCAYRTGDLFRQVCRRAHVRLVTAHWLNDVLHRKRLFVPNMAIHYPSPYEANQPEKLPLARYFFTMTGFEGLERARLRYMIRALGGKYSGHLTKWHTHLLARDTGKSAKLKKANDWSLCIVNGLWLSELYLGNTFALKQPLEDRYKRLTGTPTIDHFSFDQIFVHDLLQAWSQPIRVTDDMLNSAIRRHHEQHSNASSSSNLHDSLDLNPPHFKQIYHYSQPWNAALVSSPSSDPSTGTELSVMLSGFDSTTVDRYTNIIQSLGGHISTLPHSTTHLIMKKFLPTEKFYQCVNYVSYILNSHWLEKCSEEKCLLPIEDSDWLAKDESNVTENIFKQSIEKRRQRENRPLFQGYRFFFTPSLQPSYTTLKSIVYATGGAVDREFPSIKQLATCDETTKMPVCWIVSCDADKSLWKDLAKYNNSDVEIKILSMDFILESIVQQEIRNIHSFTLKI